MQQELLEKQSRISTVGRNRKIEEIRTEIDSTYSDDNVNLFLGNSLDYYEEWESPTCIISDGAYGVLGFQGDTVDHKEIPDWYEEHVKAWSEKATANTTLWFWNSEIGWAAAHPILEKYGWKYVNANVWNKGKGHIAGNVNTSKIRRFPVVTEVCVQYVKEAKINGMTLQEWLVSEWKRSGLPLKKANEACNVKNVATRKYLTKDHLWYYPPVEMFEKLSLYCNENGKPEGKPYFTIDGKKILSPEEWRLMRSKFDCPHGYTNVWDRPALRGKERVLENKKVVHLNQKPLDLMELIINSSTERGDVVWEPFGGLFSASLAAKKLGRKAFSCEVDKTYFYHGSKRFENMDIELLN